MFKDAIVHVELLEYHLRWLEVVVLPLDNGGFWSIKYDASGWGCICVIRLK